MDLEALKSIFEGFDLAAFLPELDSIVGWAELLMRIFVMTGPLLLLGFGIMYLVAPPKEANYSLGYRFFWSMSSLHAWTFTHRLVGVVWTVLGLVLTVVMAVYCNAFRRMEIMDVVDTAIVCIFWQLALIVAACLLCNVIIVICFDRHGFFRFGDEE